MERSKDWTTDCPVYFNINGTTTYRQNGAVVEVIYQGFADEHPWKERENPRPQIRRRLTPEQAVAEIMAIEKEIAAAHKATSAAAHKAASYAAYCEALPENLAGFRRGHFGRAWELMDLDGAYVLSIPTRAAVEGWTAGKLESWIDEQLSAEGFGD